MFLPGRELSAAEQTLVRLPVVDSQRSSPKLLERNMGSEPPGTLDEEKLTRLSFAKLIWIRYRFLLYLEQFRIRCKQKQMFLGRVGQSLNRRRLHSGRILPEFEANKTSSHKDCTGAQQLNQVS